MQAFTDAVNKAIMSSLQSTIKGYITEFSKVLVEQINEEQKEWKVDEVVAIWNKLATDFVVKKGVKKGEKKDVDESSPKCEHIFGKGEKKDQQCDGCVSEKSTTKKFCVKHYKQNEKDEPSKKKEKSSDEVGSCCYELKKGENIGDACGKNVSKNSKTGKYCAKHVGEEKAIKKVNKNDVIKALKDKIKEMEDDGDFKSEVLEHIASEFGFLSVYNLESIAPKLYKEYQESVDEFIDENRENHESLIKEQEDEDAKAKKSSGKKTASKKDDKKAASKKGKKDDKKGKKDDKAEESKAEESKESEEEEKEEEEKKSSKKSEKEEKVESSKVAEDTEINEESDDVEEEAPKIKAKKFKTGTLKGQVYFEDEKMKCQYLLESSTRTVLGKVVNDKKVDMTEEDNKRVTKYWTLKL